MNGLIVYGSHYGATRRYAQELSERTGLHACPLAEAGDLSGREALVYLGGMYAGGVLGLKQAVKRLDGRAPRRLLIATVGLADPREGENAKNLRAAVARALPEELLRRAKLYHLRGGIDYEKLTLPHRGMMRLAYERARRQPEAKRSAEDRAIIATYGKAVDMVDFAALEPLCASLREETMA